MKYHSVHCFIIFFITLFLLFSCQEKKVQNTQKKIKLAEIGKILDRAYTTFEEARYDSSFFYFNKAKNEAEKIQDTSRIVHSLGWMADIQHNQGDFNGSEFTCLEALKVLNNSKNFPYGETNLYITLGTNYLDTYDFETAELCYRKAINHKTDTLTKACILNNIALVYLADKKYEKAEKILKPLLQKREVKEDTLNYAIIQANLGFIYFKLQKKKALELLLSSLKTRIKLKQYVGLSGNYNYLSFYFEKTNAEKSKEYALLGLEISRKLKNPLSELEFLDLLIRNSNGGTLKKYATEYVQINDSLKKASQKAKHVFAKIQYDSKREKDENLRLKNESIQQAQKIQKRNITIVLTIATMTLIGLLIIRKIRLNSKKEKVNAAYSTEVRLSQKLHDELANDLFQTIAFAEGQDLSTKENKETLIANLDIIYNQTRNISRENNSIETEASYLPNLKGLFFDFNTQQQHIITVGLDTIKWNSIENHTKITIFRIVQELLVNMKKHSNCTVAVFNFEIILNVLQISYRDNGLGLQNQTLQLKNGLSNLESRVQSIDGTATFNTMNESGFNAQFQIPI